MITIIVNGSHRLQWTTDQGVSEARVGCVWLELCFEVEHQTLQHSCWFLSSTKFQKDWNKEVQLYELQMEMPLDIFSKRGGKKPVLPAKILCSSIT